MRYLVLAAALVTAPGAALAQMSELSVEIVEHFEDRTIRIVEHFEDESWQVVGECSSSPTESIKIVEHFEDLQVRIVDHFPDRTVCIADADELDEDTRRMLHLTD
ncbi:hypothetical protein HFP51_01245 [Parasphingopyxis sp. CP4]|uniref:hypothetical protein n=1 Tax=Parasphingopyxis sp. CP4 TaxID=2724527 RepID=UPI0015A3A48D|nr:hypothetical protein [Parasphingopyxis sp. CP4]QLC20929.1 hypothetical protein HFP51_01245 [Parasphingopyxis sp. CP4]